MYHAFVPLAVRSAFKRECITSFPPRIGTRSVFLEPLRIFQFGVVVGTLQSYYTVDTTENDVAVHGFDVVVYPFVFGFVKLDVHKTCYVHTIGVGSNPVDEFLRREGVMKVLRTLRHVLHGTGATTDADVLWLYLESKTSLVAV